MNPEAMSEEEYRRYVREKVERGMRDYREGRFYTEEEANQIINSWFDGINAKEN